MVRTETKHAVSPIDYYYSAAQREQGCRHAERCRSDTDDADDHSRVHVAPFGGSFVSDDGRSSHAAHAEGRIRTPACP